jgi:ATP adenylyltransferase
MNQLWAPWRMAYIADIDKAGAGCVFCAKVSAKDDRESLILHVAEIGAIDRDTSTELWDLLCRAKQALRETMHPDGFNIGINLGRTAGAGIDTHLHAHIVPRWNGDTNFMPVVGETKVISQELGATYDTLLPAFRSTI